MSFDVFHALTAQTILISAKRHQSFEYKTIYALPPTAKKIISDARYKCAQTFRGTLGYCKVVTNYLIIAKVTKLIAKLNGVI